MCRLCPTIARVVENDIISYTRVGNRCAAHTGLQSVPCIVNIEDSTSEEGFVSDEYAGKWKRRPRTTRRPCEAGFYSNCVQDIDESEPAEVVRSDGTSDDDRNRVAARLGVRISGSIAAHECMDLSVCTSMEYPKRGDRKSTRLNSSHSQISYAVFCLKKKKQLIATPQH